MGAKYVFNPLTGNLDTTDVVAFNGEVEAGTAAAPSIFFTGDNTGIYSPGADQLAISTGGTGRLFVDANGKVGVGTSSPTWNLHVSADGNCFQTITSSTTTDAGLLLGDTDSAARGQVRYANTTDSLLIYTAGSEKLRITSDGKLGLGITSPAHALTVNGGFPQIGIPDGLGNYSTIGVAQGGSGQGNLIISASTSADQTIFERGGSESCRIDGSGRLLVGTSTASDDIRAVFSGRSGSVTGACFVRFSQGNTTPSNGSTLGELRFTDSAAGVGALISTVVEGTWTSTSSHPTRLVFSTTANGASSTTERMRIDSSGRVGINTTSPGKKLAVGASDISLQTATFEGSSRSEEYRLLRSDTGSTNGMAAIGMNGAGTNGYLGEIKFYTGVSDLFTTSLQERARIDSSGRLLVGTSTSTTFTNGNGTTVNPLFEVQSDADSSASILLRYDSGGAGAARAGSIALLRFGDGAATPVDHVLGEFLWLGEGGSSNPVKAASIHAAVDGTAGTDDMPGRIVLSTTPSGSAAPVERMRIDSGGSVLIDTPTRTINTLNYGSRIGGGGAPGVFQTSRNVNGTGATAAFYGNAGVLNVKGDGDCENTNNSYAGISDVRLKENIINANSQWDDLRALQVRKYNFKSETGFNTHTQIGLIAQEVELVSPGLVGESIDEETGESTKSVNYSVLYMKAVKALQEAMERIETLEAKVAALEVS